MATASSLIIRGLQMVNLKAIGGTLTSDEQTAYLAVMNAMLDAWSTERLMCFQLLQESQALTSSVGSYTIGSGGAFNTTRPTKIVDPCFIRDASGFDTPLKLINADAYGKKVQKTVDGTRPSELFYDQAYVAGLGTLYLFPEPSAGLTLYINSWKAVPQFAAIGTTMALPPGYEEALSSNFAVRAAAGVRPISAETYKIARESKAAIQGVNLPDSFMQLDAGVVYPGLMRGRNILTGP